MKTKYLPLFLVISLFFSSCAIIRPGQVGVKQRLGKMGSKTVKSGVVAFNPFTSRVIKLSTQTNNLKLILNLPSKEGLSVRSEISILHRIEADSIKTILTKYGKNYETIIASIFRSASSDVCARYFAKDMHSGKRADIEHSIRERMVELIDGNGIIIESVLMKSIQLPDGLARSIEQKLQAEQDAMRMQFILEQEKLEAERKIIKAKGERDAQKIQAEGLTEEILRLKQIEAMLELSKSGNAKVIITNGESPMIIEGE
jgi:regulator of protease activity HflC (stomatin/prohibitin superfamily)